jgi:hypothetical protein
VSSLDLLASPLVLAIASALVFLAAGSQDARLGSADHGVLWAVLSAALSAVILSLRGSWGIVLLAQIALFFGIGAFRAWRDSGR